ncbi:hypothetical protein EW146_g6575 [Bondarzewia mesenterica]|uniref:NADP-dependent oxidoreductase domain-containing protein n=1 Tax=Bondarzewia mesenterica TaxID=1095465 RepID=A0A4S4LQ78_9AGAM|nr:hypothetical protein EW146_g6575 [Bondarzewia mesenterica]
MPFPRIVLNDGNEIPAIGFGTGSALFGKDATQYVNQALEAGFSHIDTAAIYGNEESVGTAIRESGLERSDMFITTKYDGGDIQKGLGLKSVDLYIIHFPRLVQHNFEGSWREFEMIKEVDLAKSIGVSNFSVDDLKTIVKTAKIKPAVNQARPLIRFHPYNYASYKEVLEYSAKHGIIIEAYGSLAPITTYPNGPVQPVLATISKRIGGSPAQVIFKWVLAKGAVVVTTSSKSERLREYLTVADLPDLTAAEVAAIDEAGAKVVPAVWRRLFRTSTGTNRVRVWVLLSVIALLVQFVAFMVFI